MATTCTYSFKPELLARFHKIVPPGQRSVIINKLIAEYCDKYDGEAAALNMRYKWIVEHLVPYVQKYAKDNKVGIYDIVDNKSFYRIVKEELQEVTRSDVNEAVAYLWRVEEYGSGEKRG